MLFIFIIYMSHLQAALQLSFLFLWRIEKDFYVHKSKNVDRNILYFWLSFVIMASFSFTF